jgi:hypothetical protein
MRSVHEVPKRAYINVMEMLVEEEVAKQIKGLPPRILKYLKQTEVETYALNRLPSLYASSEKGWQHQYEKAKRELYSQIKNAVRQALAAVQVDPIRSSEPLNLSYDEDAEVALELLRALYQQPDLGWDDAVDRLRGLLASRQGNRSTPEANAPVSHRTRHRSDSMDSESHPHYWRPGTYGGDVSWRQRQVPAKTPAFDWNDPRYSK